MNFPSHFDLNQGTGGNSVHLSHNGAPVSFSHPADQAMRNHSWEGKNGLGGTTAAMRKIPCILPQCCQCEWKFLKTRILTSGRSKKSYESNKQVGSSYTKTN